MQSRGARIGVVVVAAAVVVVLFFVLRDSDDESTPTTSVAEQTTTTEDETSGAAVNPNEEPKPEPPEVNTAEVEVEGGQPVGGLQEIEFPSIQTYDDGEVVRWIQSPDSEEDPAPTVTLDEAEHGAESEETADGEDDDGGSDGLAIAGLVVGALGLITGGTALARSRRG